MELKNYVTLNDKGEIVFDNEKFETDYNSNMDRERQKASDTAYKNAGTKLRDTIKAEVTAEIENNAKLSAEELLQKDREALQAERKQYQAERIANLYKDSNLFSEDEIEIYSGITGKDFNETLDKATKIIESRKKYNEDYKTKFEEEMMQKQPRNSGGNGIGNSNDKFAQMAKDLSQNEDDAPVEL